MLKSLDDDPEIARVAARQLSLNRWYRLLALVPFAVLLFIDFEFFPNSNNAGLFVLVFASLFWAMGVAGYAFYLLFWFKCPNCGNRFGLGTECRSCGLRRHAPATGLIEDILSRDEE